MSEELNERADEYKKEEQARANVLLLFLILGVLVVIAGYLLNHVSFPALNFSDWQPVTVESKLWTRAYEWVLWAVGGTLVYLIAEVGTNYHSLEEKISSAIKKAKAKQDASRDANDTMDVEWPLSFRDYIPWYVSTLVKGPIIALVILLFFNAADLELTGTEDAAFRFNFAELDHSTTLVLAFVLGFYSRVAREILNGIVKNIFSRAWAEAHEEFEITQEETEILPGKSTTFRTSPPTEVVWAATEGSINATGMYTAPSKAEVGVTVTATITAVSTGLSPLSRYATIIIKGEEGVE